MFHDRFDPAADAAQREPVSYTHLDVYKRQVLFEAGVIKHREEELALRDPERQARMVDAIATGIAACLYGR